MTESHSEKPGATADVAEKAAKQGVNIAQIEREIAQMWQSLSENDASVTRACLWNIVLAPGGKEAIPAAHAAVDQLVVGCPSRVLHLEPTDDPEAPPIAAWVSANCHLAPGGGKLICSEEITIAVGMAGLHHVAPLVRALTVPELPTALWCFGSAALPRRARNDQHIEKAVLGSVDRIIWDSALMSEPEATISEMDLAWIRLAPLRASLSSMFDPPIGGAPLNRLAQLSIDHLPNAERAAQLLLGWVALALKWQGLEKLGTKKGEFRALSQTGEAVTVKIGESTIGGECDESSDNIFEMRMVTAHGERFAVTNVGDGFVRLDVAGHATRLVRSASRGVAEQVSLALGSAGTDPTYRKVVKFLRSSFRGEVGGQHV